MSNSLALVNNIESKIFTIRGLQVMMDRDLAELYGVETRVLKQAVNRNAIRFPAHFMFELSENEIENVVSQSVIPSKKHLGGSKPYVFTEQGVAMLSAVLRSDIAVKISIRIMDAFIAMRKLISVNTGVVQRLENVEQKQIETDKKIDKIFDALESKDITPKCGLFFNGQIFNAYVFASDLIKSAKKSIILIDNYADETVLVMLTDRKPKVTAHIYAQKFTEKLKLSITKHSQQYELITVSEAKNIHDRFLIIDNTVYLIGASIKDLGNKLFAFSKMEIKPEELLKNI